VHALERQSERAQLVPERERDDVAAMKKEIRAAAELETAFGQRASAARQVRVGDDGDPGQTSDGSRNLPSR
jgi:hypothetical protein